MTVLGGMFDPMDGYGVLSFIALAASIVGIALTQRAIRDWWRRLPIDTAIPDRGSMPVWRNSCEPTTSIRPLESGLRTSFDGDNGLRRPCSWRGPSMARLSDDAFRATFGEPMTRVSPTEGPTFDFWPYFDAIPATDFEKHDCSSGLVGRVWREPSGRFEHVLVNSEDRNVFMVLVLNPEAGEVQSHCLLDLNREYGLGPP